MPASSLTAVFAEYPSLAPERRAFEAWLETRAPRPSWGELNLGDLGLCWLCLEGDGGALRELERRIKRVVQATAGARGDGDFVGEVLQRVQQRLLVGPQPRLGAYRGKGALVQYLKAVASSVTVDLSRAAPTKEVQGESRKLLAAADLDEGADARLAHQDYRAHFTAAFKEALEVLTAEERTWLRMRFIDGLSKDAVAAAFGVHRTTAMRRLEKAQQSLLEETRRLLRKRLKLPARELESLVRSMRPSLAENLSRLLPRSSR